MPSDEGAPGALQLPVLDLPPADGLQLGQDLVPGLLVLAKLNAGGHQQQPLHLLQVGAGVVAQGALLPHVQEQLGQRGGPEHGVAHHQGGVVLLPAGDPAGAEAQGQLALGHVHPLLLQAGLRPGVEAHLTVRLQPLLRPGQAGQGGGQGFGHPVRGGGAAVVELDLRRGQQLLIALPQLPRGEGGGAPLVPQLVHPEGLPLAHELGEAGQGVVPLVVYLGPDAVHQVGPLPRHIVGIKHPLLGAGPQEQLPQQGGGPLQDRLPLQGVGVVQEAGRKPHALSLPLLADDGLDGPAVQLVQGGGQGLQVRVGFRPPAEHRRNQGVGRGGLRRQGGHQGEGQV